MPNGERNDQRLAMAALEKQRRGDKPTREEAAALRRVQRAQDDALRLEHFQDIRKKEWREWSGCQDKVLNEQCQRYGIPIGSPPIVLPTVVHWLHRFLAENAHRLGQAEEADSAMEEFRRVRTERERLLLERERRQWLSRNAVHAGHSRIASLLRGAGDALDRQFGPVARKILNDALDNCQREVDRLLDADDDDADQPGA